MITGAPVGFIIVGLWRRIGSGFRTISRLCKAYSALGTVSVRGVILVCVWVVWLVLERDRRDSLIGETLVEPLIS